MLSFNQFNTMNKNGVPASVGGSNPAQQPGAFFTPSNGSNVGTPHGSFPSRPSPVSLSVGQGSLTSRGVPEDQQSSMNPAGPFNAFDVDFDMYADMGLLSAIPYASLTEDSNLPYPTTTTTAASGSSLHPADTNPAYGSGRHSVHGSTTHKQTPPMYSSNPGSFLGFNASTTTTTNFAASTSQAPSAVAAAMDTLDGLVVANQEVSSCAGMDTLYKEATSFSFTPQTTEGRQTNSGASNSPLSSSEKTSGNSGNGSECDSANPPTGMRFPNSKGNAADPHFRRGYAGAFPSKGQSIESGHSTNSTTSPFVTAATSVHKDSVKNKNFFERIPCLPVDNFNVLTPDKRVMVSIPARHIVPTNGSRNYLKKNRGTPCSAEDMTTNSHGNSVLADPSASAHARGGGATKMMFFSFCLCKSYSVVGGRCHHGDECDFIHCIPERLPQVVSTDSGTIIEEIIGKKESLAMRAKTSAEAASAVQPVLGSADSISTFQVHWSTPVPSLDETPYARLPSGHVVYIKKENSRNNLQAIPSELIYKTIGGVEAVRERRTSVGGGGNGKGPHDYTPFPGDARAPLRICKHYEREKCARGPLCHFIHPVVLAEDRSGKNNFTAFLHHQQEQQQRAVEQFQRSQQQVNQQRLAAHLAATPAPVDMPGLSINLPSGSGPTNPPRPSFAPLSPAALYQSGPSAERPPPPMYGAPVSNGSANVPSHVQQNLLAALLRSMNGSAIANTAPTATPEQLLALLSQLTAGNNGNGGAGVQSSPSHCGHNQPTPTYGNANPRANMQSAPAVFVMQNPDGSFRLLPSVHQN